MRTTHSIIPRTLRTGLLAGVAVLATGTALAAPPPPGPARMMTLDQAAAPARMIATSNQAPWIYINHFISNFALDFSVAAYDPDGAVTYFIVDLGDGTTIPSTGAPVTAQHVYAAPGYYTISVTALDNLGAYSFQQRTVWISGTDST